MMWKDEEGAAIMACVVVLFFFVDWFWILVSDNFESGFGMLKVVVLFFSFFFVWVLESLIEMILRVVLGCT